MLYRTMPGTGERVSVLGFGAMRLPCTDPKDMKTIDEPRAIEMIRHAIDQGVNFVDTAWGYHGEESEPFLAKALADGYRDKVFLSTKLPTYLVEKPGDLDRYLDEQLERLDTGRIDFYLLHALNRARWTTMKENGYAGFLERAKADGRIKHAGFSFHGDREVFKEIVDSYGWGFCLIMYNYLDEQHQAGREGLEYAHARGLGIMVMEPLRGGKLAGGIPDDILAIWNRAAVKRTPAEWALRWVWDHPQVSVVLSGMSTLEQVKENLEVADAAQPDSLADDERLLVEEVKAAYKSRLAVGCTTCGYCLPCPEGVAITSCFNMLNSAGLFGNHEQLKDFYPQVIAEENRAANCTECGACEDKCPQELPVRAKLKEVVEMFES